MSAQVPHYESRESTGRGLIFRFVLVTGLLIVAVLVTIVQLFSHKLSDVSNNLSRTGIVIADEFDRFLSTLETEMSATSTAITGGATPNLLLREALERQPSIFDLSLITPDGHVSFERQRAGKGASQVLAQPWLSVVRNGEIYIGNVDYEEYGVPMVDIAVPVLDAYGNFSATLRAKVDMTALWITLTRPQIGSERVVYIVDGYGRLLIHTNLPLVERKLRFDDVAQMSAAQLSKEQFVIYRTFDDKLVTAISRPMKRINWYVIVEQPVSIVAHSLQTVFLVSVVLLIVMIGSMLNSILFIRRRLTVPLALLQAGVNAVGAGDLTHRIDLDSYDEFGALAHTFNNLADRLEKMITTLEQQVSERTRGLMAAAKVSRATTSVLEQSELLRSSVELVKEYFDLYYVGIFLVDEEGEYAVLRAGTGEAGRQMLANGHKLKVGGHSMIGQCVARQEARIALDVGEEAVRFENPYLPDTHSELALPLKARGRVLGAMTVQSTEVAAFDEASITMMQTVADQLAVAIDNARLYAEAQAAIKEMQAVQQRYFGDAWAKFSRQRDIKGYAWEMGSITPLRETLPPEVESVFTRYVKGQQLTTEIMAEDALLLPIMEHGQPIGLLGVRDVEKSRKWNRAQLTLVRAIVEQFAQAIENLRLMNETQRSAAREQKAGEVVAGIRSEVEIDDILRRALVELGEALNAEWGGVHLGVHGVEDEPAQVIGSPKADESL